MAFAFEIDAPGDVLPGSAIPFEQNPRRLGRRHDAITRGAVFRRPEQRCGGRLGAEQSGHEGERKSGAEERGGHGNSFAWEKRGWRWTETGEVSFARKRARTGSRSWKAVSFKEQRELLCLEQTPPADAAGVTKPIGGSHDNRTGALP
jgi:hypothetical protein